MWERRSDIEYEGIGVNNGQTKKHRKSLSWFMTKRNLFLTMLGFIMLLLTKNYFLSMDIYGRHLNGIDEPVPGLKGYLVDSDRCKIPDIDAFQPEVMKYFTRQKPFVSCIDKKPLTRVHFNATSLRYTLLIVPELIESYSTNGDIDCCYQVIERNVTGKDADNIVNLAACVTFRNGAQLSPTIDSLLVKCYHHGRQIYINGHPLLPERAEIRERLSKWRATEQGTTNKATSVLMIGIDSVSRINLGRAMPQMTQYLQDNKWFELSGYNKVGLNTFPNLMAVLAGLNDTNAYTKCKPTELNGLDHCDLIWNAFREHGYITSYAEDASDINTFNYLKVGFERPPVDYYFRPYLLALEKQLPKKRDCFGYKHAAEHIYDYAIDLAKRYPNDPYFGLFWTSTTSHDDMGYCSAMDELMVNYFKILDAMGTLNSTIVIFFSDHGMRYGPARKTISGYLEERLPFNFISLPPHLRAKHPEFVSALEMNKHRLTTPFDLHQTLKHMLQLSGRLRTVSPLPDCERCQSLLAPVPANRSCEDIAIEEHWCTCNPYQKVDTNSADVRKIAENTVQHINHYLTTHSNGTYATLCKRLSLARIDNAYMAQPLSMSRDEQTVNQTLPIYRINFHVYPSQAFFETTVHYNASSGVSTITGDISRLNMYGRDAHCVKLAGVEKFCSCRNKRWW